VAARFAAQPHAEYGCFREAGVMMETVSISKQDIAAMSTAEVAELATRLEQDNYTNAFDGLNDWHLLRAIAFQRPELVEPYVHILDLEPYDEA
jgi:hypothetical protein